MERINMSNRKKAEEFILEFCKDIEPSGYNLEIYKKAFELMSDKDFDSYMKDIRDGKAFLVLFKPLYKANGLTVENNESFTITNIFHVGIKIFIRHEFKCFFINL
jgi:hypothetical protein